MRTPSLEPLSNVCAGNALYSPAKQHWVKFSVIKNVLKTICRNSVANGPECTRSQWFLWRVIHDQDTTLCPKSVCSCCLHYYNIVQTVNSVIQRMFDQSLLVNRLRWPCIDFNAFRHHIVYHILAKTGYNGCYRGLILHSWPEKVRKSTVYNGLIGEGCYVWDTFVNLVEHIRSQHRTLYFREFLSLGECCRKGIFKTRKRETYVTLLPRPHCHFTEFELIVTNNGHCHF